MLNSATARPMPGTQAQKVILVAFGPHDPPATTVTLELALGLGPELELDPALVYELLETRYIAVFKSTVFRCGPAPPR